MSDFGKLAAKINDQRQDSGKHEVSESLYFSREAVKAVKAVNVCFEKIQKMLIDKDIKKY